MDTQQTYNPNSFGIKKKIQWQYYAALVGIAVVATMVKLLFGGALATYIETGLMLVDGAILVYTLVLRKK